MPTNKNTDRRWLRQQATATVVSMTDRLVEVVGNLANATDQLINYAEFGARHYKDAATVISDNRAYVLGHIRAAYRLYAIICQYAQDNHLDTPDADALLAEAEACEHLAKLYSPSGSFDAHDAAAHGQATGAAGGGAGPAATATAEATTEVANGIVGKATINISDIGSVVATTGDAEDTTAMLIPLGGGGFIFALIVLPEGWDEKPPSPLEGGGPEPERTTNHDR